MLAEDLVECFVLSEPQELFSLFLSDRGRVVWQAEQHVEGGEFGERVTLSFEPSSFHWAGDAVYIWDGGLRALSGPAFAPDRLQGGVRQPQTPQLWSFASRNSGTVHDDCCFPCCFFDSWNYNMWIEGWSQTKTNNSVQSVHVREETLLIRLVLV